MAVSATSSALPNGCELNDFILRGVVGMGGFGIVYRAWDPQLEREVAIKEYLPSALAQRGPHGHVEVLAPKHQELFDAGMRSFINEARLLAQFDHPALVKVYRFWEANGTAYMVMPLYKGVPLKSWWSHVAHSEREAELRRVVTVLCNALDTLHQQQCFHRDIAPDNVLMLQDTGQPVLLDFGAARRLIGSSTQAFTVVLKASYAPIEQYAEDPQLQQGPWTDVYALGAVMHDLMTGKPPPSSVARMIQDCYQPLTERMSHYSHPLCGCVDDCLQVLPVDRLQNVQQLLLRLHAEDVLPGAPSEPTQILPRPINPGPEATPPPRRFWAQGKVIAGVALLSAVAVLLTIGVAMHGNTPDAPHPKQPDSAAAPAPAPTADSLIESAWRTVEQHGVFQPLLVDTTKPVLTIGKDLLTARITSPLSGWLSVYTFTTEGQFIRLFPNDRVPELRATAGQPLPFPPASEPIQSAGPAGTNRLWFLVSQQPPVDTDLHWIDHYGYGLLALDTLQSTADGGQVLGQALLRSVGCMESPCRQPAALATLQIDEVP
ncbi:MAG TPA: protein kinase [Limnobacter sp.]|uniref:serine/threonine protein kinase n=1 Tax=Limnobacter sp. TaxID=2003368 RepID=UPI002EDA1495